MRAARPTTMAATALAAAAAAAAAAATPARADGAADATTLGFDTLLYTDTDNVIVSSSAVRAAAPLGDDPSDGSEVHAQAVVDAVTAASVDVITEATPRFREVREEADLGASYRVGAWLPSVRYRLSREPDYLSNGGGVGLQRRLGPDTTLEISDDLTYDLVRRSGTSPDVFEKTLVTDGATVSVSQVLDPATVVRVAASFIGQHGYLEKPYRYVPLFDQAGLAAAAAAGTAIGLGNFSQYRLAERPPEEVPDLRLRGAVAVRALRWLDAAGASLRLDYRFYLDDWGVRSHTGEIGLRLVRGRRELALTERVYEQTAADFWRRVYVVAPGTMPVYRTVDRDLSHFVADTAELGYTSHHDTWRWYATLGAMYTRYFDYLFLGGRLAILAGGGVAVDL